MPRLKKKDYTLKELRKFDGTGENGRVLICVLGKIYDVTKGKRFYGPSKNQTNKLIIARSNFVLSYLDGPYAGFAGRDASRGLATFSVEAISDEYDDLSDLKPSEMDQVSLDFESQ